MLRLAGFTPSAAGARPATGRQVFSIGFEAAIKRLQLLYGPRVLGASQSSLELLKAARDVTAHGGAVSNASTETLLEVLTALARTHAALAPLSDTTVQEFWGTSIDVVLAASKKQKDKNSQQVRTLYAAARHRVDQLFAGVDEETVRNVLDQTSYKVEPSLPNEYFRTCPV